MLTKAYKVRCYFQFAEHSYPICISASKKLQLLGSRAGIHSEPMTSKSTFLTYWTVLPPWKCHQHKHLASTHCSDNTLLALLSKHPPASLTAQLKSRVTYVQTFSTAQLKLRVAHIQTFCLVLTVQQLAFEGAATHVKTAL